MKMINVKGIIYNAFVIVIALFAVFGFVEVFDFEIFYDFVDSSWVFIVTTLLVIALNKGRTWSNKTDDK